MAPLTAAEKEEEIEEIERKLERQKEEGEDEKDEAEEVEEEKEVEAKGEFDKSAGTQQGGQKGLESPARILGWEAKKERRDRTFSQQQPRYKNKGRDTIRRMAT